MHAVPDRHPPRRRHRPAALAPPVPVSAARAVRRSRVCHGAYRAIGRRSPPASRQGQPGRTTDQRGIKRAAGRAQAKDGDQRGVPRRTSGGRDDRACARSSPMRHGSTRRVAQRARHPARVAADRGTAFGRRVLAATAAATARPRGPPRSRPRRGAVLCGSTKPRVRSRRTTARPRRGGDPPLTQGVDDGVRAVIDRTLAHDQRDGGFCISCKLDFGVRPLTV